MSRITSLLRDLSSRGVRYSALGDFCDLVRGNGMPKSDFTESGVGCIHYGQIYTTYGTWVEDTISFVSPETARRLAKVDPGDVIITNTSENIEDVCKAVAWLGKAQIVTGGHATVLKHDQDPRFLAYYFQTPQFHADKKRLATGTKVIDVSAKSLATIRVPIPDIEVQRAIVRVLDSFSALEAELEAELEARRKQYAHYRDALLTFPAQHEEQASKQASKRARIVPVVALGELGTFTRGRRFINADFVPSGIGCIHYGEIYTHYGLAATNTRSFVSRDIARNLRMARKGDLVIAGTGENVEEVCKAVAWLGDDEVAVHDDCYIFTHSLDPKYVAHYFRSSQFHRQKSRYAAGAKMIRVSAENLERIQIPVPPLAEQRRIADILDQFDALVSDLSIGLPAELQARRQQYEYYRDRLLAFREAA